MLARARPAGVPLITFSNDSTVAARDVFVMGHQPDAVDRAVRSIMHGAQGRGRFALLVPTGEYGARAEAAFRDAGRAPGRRHDRRRAIPTTAATPRSSALPSA